jgi:hypothetical protein|tara:strand:+ start:268 stop:534 length:267 start_codon:yes stop_codon:yes gene_type:complete
MANGNGNNAIQAVTEHTLVKTFTPLVVAALLATVGWLFSTVMDVEKIALENSTHIKHLTMAEEDFSKQIKQVESKLTDLRINVGRLVH